MRFRADFASDCSRECRASYSLHDSFSQIRGRFDTGDFRGAISTRKRTLTRPVNVLLLAQGLRRKRKRERRNGPEQRSSATASKGPPVTDFTFLRSDLPFADARQNQAQVAVRFAHSYTFVQAVFLRSARDLLGRGVHPPSRSLLSWRLRTGRRLMTPKAGLVILLYPEGNL